MLEAGPGKKYNLPYYLSLSYALINLSWVNDTFSEGFKSGIVMEGGFDASASEVRIGALVTPRSNSAPDPGVCTMVRRVNDIKPIEAAIPRLKLH